MSSRLPWPSIRPTSHATSSESRLPIRASGPRLPGSHLRGLVCLGFLLLAVASCQQRSDAPVVLKIGVLAPFEGTGRELGYAILPTVRHVLETGNAGSALGPYRVALVALNDELDPDEAATQAKVLVQDPDVLAVVGLWSEATTRSAVPVLEEAGVPSVLSASYSSSGAMAFSLCPAADRVAAELLRKVQEFDGPPVVVTGPDNALRRALLERSPGLSQVSESAPGPCNAVSHGDCLVIHTGDAVGSAEALSRWRSAGWRGLFVVGPDAARPWFIPQAGSAGEGVRALICGNPDSLLPDQDASLRAASDLAGAATQSVLSALGRVIARADRPTRSAVAEELSFQTLAQDPAWMEVIRGVWVPLHE
jgi:Periplasmic binding protein